VDPVTPAPPGKSIWRLVIVAAIVLVVVNLAVILAVNSDTSDPEGNRLPNEIEAVSPEPAAVADRRIAITADLRDDLTGVLVIDNVRIPEDQLDPISQGIITFRPGPDRTFNEFEAGVHTVQVLYWPADEPEPETPGSFGWTFRASA
jgi:hypothetical protein